MFDSLCGKIEPQVQYDSLACQAASSMHIGLGKLRADFSLFLLSPSGGELKTYF